MALTAASALSLSNGMAVLSLTVSLDSKHNRVYETLVSAASSHFCSRGAVVKIGRVLQYWYHTSTYPER